MNNSDTSAHPITTPALDPADMQDAEYEAQLREAEDGLLGRPGWSDDYEDVDHVQRSTRSLFKPSREIFAEGSDPVLLDDEAVCDAHWTTYLRSAGCGECYTDSTGKIRRVYTKELV